MKTQLLIAALRVTQATHHILIAAIVTAPLWTWAVMPAILACLISSVATWRVFSHAKCPVTLLENLIRKELNLQPIKGFISHYYVQPYKYFWSQRG